MPNLDTEQITKTTTPTAEKLAVGVVMLGALAMAAAAFISLPGVRKGWLEKKEKVAEKEITQAVSGTFGFQKVTVELNDVEGSGPESPWGKQVGDINKDNEIDLIVGGSDSPYELYWYENTGDVTNWPTRHLVYRGGNHGTDHEVVDVDNDNDNDIVSFTNNDELRWYENLNGAGTNWDMHIIFDIDLHDIEVFDFDQDGKVEIIARNQNNPGKDLHFFKQNGDPRTDYSWDHTQRTITGMTAGEGLVSWDIDEDGLKDIVVGGYKPKWYKNNGVWNIGAVNNWTEYTFSETWTYSKTYVSIADINNDNRDDIILSPSEAPGSSYNIWWFEKPVNPADTVVRWNDYPVDSSVETSHHFIGAADFDLDGDTDIATAKMYVSELPAGSPSKKVKIYLQDGDPKLESSWQLYTVSDNGSHSMKIVDIDQDGDFDLFGANYTDPDPIELFLNTLDPDPSLDDWTYIELDNNRDNEYFGLAMGDLNGDNLGDIASGHYAYINPGGDMSGAWIVYDNLPNNIDALLIGNVDNDQYDDIIGLNPQAELWWIEYNGSDGWTSMKHFGDVDTVSHSISSQGYVMAEIYNAGKKEIIVNGDRDRDPNDIYVFEIPADPVNDTWIRRDINAAADPVYSEGIGVGDIDDDGKNDIAVSSEHTDVARQKEVAWFKNNSGENWQEYVVGSIPDKNVDRVYIADLDGDTKKDIVVSAANGPNTSTNGIYWFKQPADPTNVPWAAPIEIGDSLALGSMNSLDVADMDNDGDIDVITGEHIKRTAGSPALRTVIFENNGVGNFTEHFVDETGIESHLGTRVYDLEGDGDLDIINIAWFNYPILNIWRNDATIGGMPICTDIDRDTYGIDDGIC
ncbi:FG-GAP repeat domain-containing protein, partial [Patescibacteria group bacterium]